LERAGFPQEEGVGELPAVILCINSVGDNRSSLLYKSTRKNLEE